MAVVSTIAAGFGLATVTAAKMAKMVYESFMLIEMLRK